MGPRTSTNPAPQTDAARAQLQSFFCTLCNKGYARQNEFAAHEASYEHNHAQRRVDLRRLNAQMSQNSASSRRGGGREDDGIIRMQVDSNSSGSKPSGGVVKKKAGFKSAFVPVGVLRDEAGKAAADPSPSSDQAVRNDEAVSSEKTMPNEQGSMEVDDEADISYEMYDPRSPTGCGPTCPSKLSKGRT